MFVKNVLLITTPARPPALEHLYEVLKEQERRLAGPDWEVLLNLFALASAERRVRKDYVVSILVLNVGEVLGEGVRVKNVWGLLCREGSCS